MTAPLNLLSKNGSYGDIQQATRYDSPDLGDCIVNGRINKMAKFKPFRNSAYGWSSASAKANARRQANYGFDLTGGADSVWFYTFSEALSTCSSRRGDWPYQRPRGRTTYNEEFRYFDFINDSSPSSSGYAGDAPNPYEFRFLPETINEYAARWEDSVRVTRVADDGQINLAEFSKSGEDITGWHYALLYSNGTSSYLVNSSTVSSLNVSAGTYVEIPIVLPSPGTYTGCVVITDSEEGCTGTIDFDDDGEIIEGTANVIYLPYSNFQIAFTQKRYVVWYSFERWITEPTLSVNGGLSLDILEISFDSNRETWGQPFQIDLSLGRRTQYVEYDEIWRQSISDNWTIPSTQSGDTIWENLGEYTLQPVSGLVSGETIYLRITLNTTGRGRSDQAADLMYDNERHFYEIPLTVI